MREGKKRRRKPAKRNEREAKRKLRFGRRSSLVRNRREIGDFALYPQMTVAQNLGFALEIAGNGKEAIKGKVAAAAASLGLEPLLDRYPRQLSAASVSAWRWAGNRA